MGGGVDEFIQPGRRFTRAGNDVYTTPQNDPVIEFDLPERIIYRTGGRVAYFGTDRAVFGKDVGLILYVHRNKHWLDAHGKRLAPVTASELAAAERDIEQVLKLAGIKAVVEHR